PTGARAAAVGSALDTGATPARGAAARHATASRASPTIPRPIARCTIIGVSPVHIAETVILSRRACRWPLGVARSRQVPATFFSSRAIPGKSHRTDMTPEHYDVLIVGAGLSGIGAAVHLHRRCPGKRYLILEGRPTMGGTWDLFRYPGIRSDSDMHTLGYGFKHWRAANAIAEGPAILDYVRETAAEHGVARHIRYGLRATRASWSTRDAAWTVETRQTETGETVRFTCNFLLMCAGYYSYQQGHTPEFECRDRFEGTIVHPQEWPEDLDYEGKRVVVIGSGATAMTLVPAMAKDVDHIVMLQRPPTYVVSLPDQDIIANALRAVLPDHWAYAITRWKNVALQQFLYRRTRTHPEQVKRKLLDMVRKELGPDYDVETHFTPRYNPWDQRLCLVPN